MPASATEPLTIEGEHPTSSNFTPGATAQTGASGGKSLQLYSATAAPAGGYVASYEITVAEASLYRLDATTIPVGVAWASPYRFRVNGGAWHDTTGARQLAVVTSELRQYELGTITLSPGSNTVEFQVTERRTSPNTNYAMFLDAFTLTPVAVELDSVVAPDRFGVFEAGETVVVEAGLNAAAPAAVPVEWTATDYDGATVASGVAEVAAGSKTADIELGAQLATGAYRIEARIEGGADAVTGAFAVLPDAASRADVEDSPFAVDVYGSKLIAPEDAEAFAHVLQLTGVDWIRDRQRWNDVINPAPGTVDFSNEQQPLAWLKAADAAGLKTLSSFHDGPSWTRTGTRELPQDLRDMYAFALAAGKNYDGLVDAWELWNEQNRKFTLESEGADRYASVMKAAALGLLDSGTDAQLVSGGLAGADPHYAQWQFRNGILDYLDAYAYHTHTTVNSSAALNEHPDFRSQIEAASPFGGDAKGRWVTEAGIALNTADANQLPTQTQEKLQARYIVTSAVESLAGGSTKQFFFIAAPYREGVSYWSMYRSPDEPMAALAAQSVMTDELGAGDYAGRVTGLPEGVAAHVFDTGAEPTAVLWAATPTTVSVPVKGNKAAVTDLMGRAVDASVKGSVVTLTVGPDPIYIAAPKGFRNVEQVAVPAPSADQVTADDFSTAERVVVQQVFDADTSKNAQLYGYGLSTTAPTALTAEVYNFNDHEVTATVSATVDGGWVVDGGGQSVTVPAGGRVDVELTVGAGSDLRQTTSDLVLVADVDGESSSPSVAELRPRSAVLSATHAIAGTDDVIRMTYTNATDATQRITGVQWQFAGESGSREASIDVAPGAAVAVDSAPAPRAKGETDYDVALVVDGVGTVSARGVASLLAHDDVPAVDRRSIVIDGVLDDLSGVTGEHLAAPGVDASSLDAEAWFTWDDDNLYLSAQVRDDKHLQSFTGNATWQADGLQFAVAPVWPGETTLRPEIQPRIEFGFALTPEGPQLYRYASGSVGGFLTDLDIAAVRDEDSGVTTYEAAVPWQTLAPIGVGPSSAAALSIVANDTDGDGTRGWVQWGGGITTAKDSELFEPVIFAPGN
ncbi:sugar-binding protein [Microbacterium jejuense]|uniref:sugar-binding protein n=1 Tax=Microbacterium jejuense TaxID=1263637 RepID=UPI0031F18FF7